MMKTDWRMMLFAFLLNTFPKFLETLCLFIMNNFTPNIQNHYRPFICHLYHTWLFTFCSFRGCCSGTDSLSFVWSKVSIDGYNCKGRQCSNTRLSLLLEFFYSILENGGTCAIHWKSVRFYDDMLSTLFRTFCSPFFINSMDNEDDKWRAYKEVVWWLHLWPRKSSY